MNTLNLDLPENLYLLIPKEIRDEMTIKTREPKDKDYSNDEKWVELKSLSTKAYKKLKVREFEIREELKELN